MNNFEFLVNFQNILRDTMSNKLIDLDFASITFSAKDDEPFFNYAQINNLITESELKKIEKAMQNLNRKPTIYFEHRKSLDNLIQFLIKHKYEKSWEDSWMFYLGNKIDTSRFNAVKKVTNNKKLEEFIKTLDACYQKNDPQNPYGKLGAYLELVRDVWYKHNQFNKLEYFIVYKNDKPVAVSTLTNYKKLGYISNVGSLKEVRGQGFGKIASLYCVKKSIENGNIEHALGTEEDHHPNEFYKRLGFKTRFTAIGYVKNN